ncbi:hypothetical protein AV530_007423 [Patagioenas fasciata monilis]|uniref:Uncharacterized protein n=1 Tax=Patagioenas fasciata monilis TaxID=372326 RepID=A0A1V4JXR4_PATFA|nr:hypothetical protein AV530_007423 [Patagioenas fasciata monilis]
MDLVAEMLVAGAAELSSATAGHTEFTDFPRLNSSKTQRFIQLLNGLMLLYMHDDTESLEDSFTVQLTDGKRTVQGTLYIYIMPVNNEIPHLSRNIVLEVEAAEKSHFQCWVRSRDQRCCRG